MARQTVFNAGRYSGDEVSPSFGWQNDAPADAVALIAYVTMADHQHNQNARLIVTVEESDDDVNWRMYALFNCFGGDGTPDPETGEVHYGGESVMRVERRQRFLRAKLEVVERPRLSVDVEFV